jgi:HlyD family secretion protein
MLRRVFNWKLLAGALAVSAILAVALWPQTSEVDVTHVSRGDLVVTVDEEGETRIRERFVIAAPVAGRLQRIELEPGDAVRRSRTVALLMPSAPALLDPRTRGEFAAAVDSAQASLGQAQATRERAQAALDRARSVAKRGKELLEAGLSSRDQFEANDAALKAAEEDRRAAEYAVARAEYELQIASTRLQLPAATDGATIKVVSPIDGVVLKRYRESEADVPAGDPLLEVGNPSNLEIVSDLLSTDAVNVSPGGRVLIEKWGGSAPLSGRVRRVEPKAFLKVSALGVEEQRVNVIIDFVSDGPPEQLGDGYRVEVRVVVAEVRNALKVPVGSLFRQGESWAVFTVENGRALVRAVELGQRNDVEAEVVTGLSDGESVILHPAETLANGALVSERTPASP